MYNRIFKADYLLFKAGCSVETVALIEIALKFFEQKRLPPTGDYLRDEHKFKLEDIVNCVFDKDSNNRFSSIKFPDSYKDDSELIENLEKMFSDDRYGIYGKTLDELITMYSKLPYRNIRELKYLFQILMEGMSLVLSRSPYVFRCYFNSIDGTPYFIIGSWANPET